MSLAEVPSVRRSLPRSSGRVLVHGARLYFERVGAGPPVVLVPEIGMDHRAWAGPAQVLARQYEVIIYDPRGRGRSGRGPGPYRDATDLAGLLDALRVRHAAMAGHAEGAEIALELVLDRPDLVRSLLLVSPKCTKVNRQLVLRYLREERPLPIEQIWERPHRSVWVRRRATYLLWMMLIPNVLRMLPAIWNHTKWDRYFPQRCEPDASDRLSEIPVPTLIVVGGLAMDLHRDAAEVLRSDLVDARLASLPDVEPYPSILLESPRTLADIMLDFLTGHDDPPPQ